METGGVRRRLWGKAKVHTNILCLPSQSELIRQLLTFVSPGLWAVCREVCSQFRQMLDGRMVCLDGLREIMQDILEKSGYFVCPFYCMFAGDETVDEEMCPTNAAILDLARKHFQFADGHFQVVALGHLDNLLLHSISEARVDFPIMTMLDTKQRVDDFLRDAFRDPIHPEAFRDLLDERPELQVSFRMLRLSMHRLLPDYRFSTCTLTWILDPDESTAGFAAGMQPLFYEALSHQTD